MAPPPQTPQTKAAAGDTDLFTVTLETPLRKNVYESVEIHLPNATRVLSKNRFVGYLKEGKPTVDW